MTATAGPRTAESARWFHRPLPRPQARLRLVCAPYAGAGAAVYRSWAELLPADTELVTVRLPGRENRLRERAAQDWSSLARDFAAALEEQVASPYMLFGHSMGAMLVYETVVGPLVRPPDRVLLSGCRAPHVPRALPAIHTLPPERFRAELGRLAGTPAAVLADPALMALLDPMLRADIRLAELWAHPVPAPLPVPVTAFWGADDEVAPPDAVAAWQTLAPHGFRAHRIDGGHFFLHERARDLLGLLADEITPPPARRRRSDSS
ncbi:thioesterase II family protein [Kitasatospora sp. NPDC091207]|uniref:thioesterase II family protein n=1 Tax=Kitasatospora sp. NPDC091207 TaxID=3364083 RepID=UPI0038219C1F